MTARDDYPILRASAGTHPRSPAVEQLNEALDEIDRLRAENSALRVARWMTGKP